MWRLVSGRRKNEYRNRDWQGDGMNKEDIKIALGILVFFFLTVLVCIFLVWIVKQVLL